MRVDGVCSSSRCGSLRLDLVCPGCDSLATCACVGVLVASCRVRPVVSLLCSWCFDAATLTLYERERETRCWLACPFIRTMVAGVVVGPPHERVVGKGPTTPQTKRSAGTKDQDVVCWPKPRA